MPWNAFSVKQTPSIPGNSSVSITDGTFPFGNGAIYRDVNVWVTTTATQATYVVNVLLNDVVQDSITSGPSKAVNNYSLQQILMKDVSLPLKVTVSNNSGVATAFVIIITGEYWS